MAVDYTKEGKIATFTINRPKAFNAMNMEAARELREAMLDFHNDPELWVGIVTGTGDRAFCAGADIPDLLGYVKEHGVDIKDPQPFIQEWKPLIAAINGLCLGGGLEIALACDIRIAVEKARFGNPEVNLGIIPGWGATQRLPRLIPGCKAAEILLMGKQIDAQEAYRIGLINTVVPPEQLMTTANEWAETICRAAPLAVKAAKETMIKAYSLSLEDGLRLESSLFSRLMDTEDYTEGVAAFTERRKANFKGK